jgi:hypothetical protein
MISAMRAARGWWGVGLVASVALVAVGFAHAPATRAASETRSLTLVVGRPDGPPVELAFEVRAESAAEAMAAARRAAAQLVPGGSIAEDGGITAQWQPWGWTWSDSELPVRVAYNPVGAPAFVGPDAVAAALQTWSSVSTSRFAYAYTGFTDRQASLRDSGPDGFNVIAWQSLDCSGGCVLGVTTREAVHESDLILNSNPAAKLGNGTGDSVDAKTVILHEMGHMAGLEHSCAAPFGSCTAAELDAVMYYQYRGIKRKLAADDIAGISALYPARLPGTSPTPPATPPPSEAVAVVLQPGWNLTQLPAGPLATGLAALRCAEGVYRWDGTAWEWWLRDAAPGLSTLGTARVGEAYWVLADGACAHVFE